MTVTNILCGFVMGCRTREEEDDSEYMKARARHDWQTGLRGENIEAGLRILNRRSGWMAVG